MPEKQKVHCPGCNRSQPKRSASAIYWCEHCRCQFDDEPDEGGSHFSDPSKRLERADEQRIRNQNRTRARMGRR